MASDGSVTSTPSCYDTFVMTGDMIIKTTAKKPVLQGQPVRSSVAGTKSAVALIEDNQAAVGNNLPCTAATQSNGRVRAATSGDSSAPIERESSENKFVPYEKSRVELDIPPDDISSDDERQPTDGAADIDVDKLPPPPDEFLLSSAVLNGTTTNVEQGRTVLSSSDWRNSLDEAIARLESELPLDLRTLSVTDVGPTSASAVCGGSSSAEVLTAANQQPSKSPLGVRSSKSQENCLHLDSEGINAVLFSIKVDDEGNSTSVEGLHSDVSVASQIKDTSSGSPTKKSKFRNTALPDLGGSANSPWWDGNGAAAAVSEGSLSPRKTVAVTDHMQPCYLVCPKSINMIANVANLSAGSASSAVKTEGGVGAKSNQVDNDDETHAPGLEEICRPQQVKDIDRPSARRLAKRLYHLDGFQKADVAKHLCKLNEFSHLVGTEYIRYFDFTGLMLDGALRGFLSRLVLSGETQERERILLHFARRYTECNPGVFNSADACHTLTCAIILLNMDLQGQNVGHKMTLSEFVDSLSELNDGENFPRDVLSNIYSSLRNEPIEVKFAADTSDPTANGNQSTASIVQTERFVLGTGVNPFLSIPDSSKTVEYKKGYVMRKCCTGPDGRKTGFMRRGWKMWYAALCDMIIYLHKDEQSCKSSTMTSAMSNVIHIHHALATRATDYLKKQHVFTLQTADWSQYLFQTSNSDDCQLWIDAINYAAANLSAPPLSAAVGSQKKFQRPLLPSAYTRLNMRDQLVQHQKYLEQIEMDLADHVKYPPERGAKARVIQDYVEKETYLQFEQRRFKTYCLLLHSRMYSLPSSVQPESKRAAIDGVDERAMGSRPESVAANVQRTTSAADRYSYHAAIAASQGCANL